MTKNEYGIVKEVLETTIDCGDELQLDDYEREAAEKCISELWKIRAYDKIIYKKTLDKQ